MMAGTFLLLGGIEMLHKAIEKVNQEKEASKRISESLADIDGKHTKIIDSQREAMEGAEVAQAEYLHNFIRNTEDAIAKASELAQAIVKAQTASSESHDNTRKGIVEKEIEAMEQRGVISHATAVKMKEQIDLQYEQQKLQRMMEQDAIEEQLTANQLSAKAGRREKLAADEDHAEAKYASAATAKAANATKIEEAQTKITDAEGIKKGLRDQGVNADTVQQLQEFVAKYGGDTGASLSDQFHFAAMKNLGMGSGSLEAHRIVSLFGSQGDKNLGLYEGADLDIKGAKSDLAHARKKQPGLDIAEGNAQSDLAAAHQAEQKNRDDIRALQEKLTEIASTNAIKEGGAQQDLGAHKANTELIDDRDIADRLRAGGAVSGFDQQRLMAGASKIAGQNVDLTTAVQIIENGANNFGIFMNQVGRLAAAMGQLDPRQQARMAEDIDRLQRQVACIAEFGHQ